MKRFSSLPLILGLALTLGLSSAFAQEVDKIGTAKMNKLVSEFHKTKAIRNKFDDYRKAVVEQRDERIKALTALGEEVKKFQKEAEIPTLSDEKRAEIFAQAARKQKEAQGLNNELRSWLQRRQSAMEEKINMEMNEIRKEVMGMVTALGEEEGYDYIFDSSGASLAGIGVLVYTKDATDLTTVLLERINADAPEEEEAE